MKCSQFAYSMLMIVFLYCSVNENGFRLSFQMEVFINFMAKYILNSWNVNVKMENPHKIQAHFNIRQIKTCMLWQKTTNFEFILKTYGAQSVLFSSWAQKNCFAYLKSDRIYTSHVKQNWWKTLILRDVWLKSSSMERSQAELKWKLCDEKVTRPKQFHSKHNKREKKKKNEI